MELYREWRVLKLIDEFGPKTFSELVDSKELSLSRNTVNKYLKILREKNWIDKKYVEDKKLNYLTTDGKIELEKILGKEDIKHKLRAYSLIEKKIKNIRDELIKRFGNIPNSILLDCVENFVEFEQYNFDKKLPSEEFRYFLAYYLARFDIQYCKSENWLRMQPDTIPLLQEEFIKLFEIDPVDLNYFIKEWGKIVYNWPVFDRKNRMWILSSKSLLYEMIMLQINIRSRRGTLQEIVFENYIFNPADEAVFIVEENRKGLQLDLDLDQSMQLINFVRRMMDVFIERKIGYSEPWLNLPSTPEELLILAVDLETELNDMDPNTKRRLEILKTLHYIYARLRNDEEAIFWGEELLKNNPKDPGMLTIMAFYYYRQKQYEKFLNLTEKTIDQFGPDLITRDMLIEYYLEVKDDLPKALELIEEAERVILENQHLINFYPKILTFKAKTYSKLNNIEQALIYAERVWREFGEHNEELYQLIVEFYKKLEKWEVLEDFCLNAYYEDEYNTAFFPALYFAHLKRKSYEKAEFLYARIKKHYPDYIHIFNDIRKESEP